MLHYYLRVYFCEFILCVVITVIIFVGIACIYVYCYFSMNPCIYEMYLSIYVLYIMFRKSSVCIYFNCMQFKKIMLHSSVGFWVCYNMFHRENESILWCIVAQPGWSGTLQYGIRASVFNTEPGWAEQVELKQNFTEDLFRSGQISSCRASMVESNNNGAELGKSPDFYC
jgi:hypothetical protein